MAELPIDDVLGEVIAHLRQAPAVVVHAPTGAGKTTRLPGAVLDAGVAEGQVWCLEPRRIAARSAARHVAHLRGVRAGTEVGWHVRFEPRFDASTRLLYLTDGLAVRRLQANALLEDVGVVVFDEFHERSLATDLALSIVRRVQDEVRDDLKIVVMSATLDATRVSDFLGGAPIVRSQGRSYPVDIRYAPRPDDRRSWERCAGGVRELLGACRGDLLAFLPGVREIDRTARLLSDLGDVDVLPLHGRLPPKAQDRALRTGPRRRVVLATNVAETSLTLDGIEGVVDTGLAKILRNDPGSGLDRLVLEPISQASADQRAGRAGRQQPGIALRLWTERSHRGRPVQDTPALRRTDLAGALLQLRGWGEPDPRAFPWVEPPPESAVDAGEALLEELGLVHEGDLTPDGAVAAALPVHPRLGVLLVQAARLGHARLGAAAAAALSERDPFRRHDRDAPPPPASTSDVLDRALALLHGDPRLRPGARQALSRIVDRLERAVRDRVRPERTAEPDPALRRAIGRGWSDRLAQRRTPTGRRARMRGGRGVILAPESALHHGDLFVCVQVDDGPTREALVRQASAVDLDWLPVREVLTTGFDPERGQVVARRERRVHDLVLDTHPAPLPDDDTVAQALARALSDDLDALPLGERPVGDLRARLHHLARVLPDTGAPDPDLDWVRERLPELCRGHRGTSTLTAQALHDAILDQLPWRVRQALDQHAPERLEVPSGSRVRLQWSWEGPPVLAVRMQEMFGCTQTPRVLGDRVPVLLHLLAPNMRPAQITEDLASFWANTYDEVRKELRRRYPKHAWPDDPLTAEPERRPRRRRR